jgi:septal ring-binding cell division protein DamX
MPFNFKENGTDLNESPRKPILYQPAEAKGAAPKLVITLVLIVVLAGAAYLLYQSGLLGEQTIFHPSINQPVESLMAAPPETLTLVSPRETLVSAATTHLADSTLQQSKTNSADSAAAPSSSGDHKKEERADSSAQAGDYTIYVARFRSKDLAEREADKWQISGSGVMITKHEGWYRVSIGKFSTRGDAKMAAEKLSESHKVGYYIGRVSE